MNQKEVDLYNEPSPRYDVALVCLNGHIVNDRFVASPQFNKKFCDKCGEATIAACPACNKPIQGDYIDPSYTVVGMGQVPAPGFCQHCGKPFPWTDRKLAAAKEMADELEGLSPDEREKLKQTLARIPHKPVEQMGGRGVRELENTELYDDPFYRPEADRLY
jgi:hypothetical protein